MPERNLASPDISGAPVTTSEGTRPLTGWPRLMLWAAGRAVVVGLVGVIGVNCWPGKPILRPYVLVVVFVSSRIFLTLLLYAIGDLTARLRRQQPER
jgi:hypothetical protein